MFDAAPKLDPLSTIAPANTAKKGDGIVRLQQLKSLQPLDPTKGNELTQLFTIVDSFARVFTQTDTGLDIIPDQEIILPLKSKLGNSLLHTTNREYNDPEISSRENTLFSTDIAAILAEIAHILELPGFTDKRAAEFFMDQLASPGGNGQYTVERLRKEYHKVADLIRILHPTIKQRLASLGITAPFTDPNTAEILQEAPIPLPTTTEPTPVEVQTAVVKVPQLPSSQTIKTETGESGTYDLEETDKSKQSLQQQAELEAYAQHEQNRLLVTYEGFLANTAAFAIAAEKDLSDIPPEQMAFLLNEAKSFLKSKYGANIPELSFDERSNLMLEFQHKVLGKAISINDVFKQKVAEAIGSNDPLLQTNIEQTLDSMVAIAGPEAIVVMFEAMDSGNATFVAQMLGIPQALDSASFEKLKKVLVLYTRVHGSELAIISGNPELFARFNSAIAELKDPVFVEQVDSLRSFIKTYSSASGRTDGAEVLSKALVSDNRSEQNLFERAKQRVTKVQGLYIGMWNNLNEAERRKTMEHIAMVLGERPPDLASYRDAPIPFGIEFLPVNFFGSISKLIAEEEQRVQAAERLVAEYNNRQTELIVQMNALATELANLPEFQISVEEDRRSIAAANLREFIIKNYLNETDLSEKQFIAQQMGVSTDALASASPLALQQWSDYYANQSGSSRGYSFSRYGLFGTAKKKSASQGTIAKAIKRANVEILSKTANIISVIPGGNAVLLGIRTSERLIGKKKTWTLIGAGGLVGLGSLGYMLGNSVLARIFGAGGATLGGLAGGIGSLVTGGSLSIPLIGAGALGGGVGGTVAGFSIEQLLKNKLGIGPSSATTAASPGPAINPPKFQVSPRLGPPAAATPAPAAPVVADAAAVPQIAQSTTPIAPPPDVGIAKAASNAVLNASIGTLAPLFGFGSLGLLTLITIFTIYAAFLVPLPGRAVGRAPSIPSIPGLQGCWPTTGSITAFRTYDTGKPHATISRSLAGFSGPGTAIDIGTNGKPTPIFTPFSGTATFFPEGMGIPEYGAYVVIKTPQFALLFGHLSGFVRSIETPTGTREIDPRKITSGIPVRAGDALGLTGDTGVSTGIHLHYESVGVDILSLLPLTPQELLEAERNERSLVTKFVSPAQCADIESANELINTALPGAN